MVALVFATVAFAQEQRRNMTFTERYGAQLNLTDMLQPAVQPGSRIDYEWPPEAVTVSVRWL